MNGYMNSKCVVVASLVFGAFLPAFASGQVDSSNGPKSTGLLTAEVDRLCAEWNTPDSPGVSVAVGRNGVLLYERGFGSANLELNVPITTESVFQVASVSKQFTAMSILLLEKRGQLSIDDEVRKYIAEFPDYGTPFTIRHLLSHTSGLRDVFLLHQALAAPAEDSGDWNEILVRRLAAQRGLNFAPGTDFQYSNGGYVLLATIVKRVSGMSLQDFAAANIFQPLGMTRTRFDDDPHRLVRNRVTGYANDGGTWRRAREEIARPGSGGNTGLLSTAGDLLRWEQNFFDGKVGGKALLAAMSTPAVLTHGVTLPYGIGVWVMDDRGLKTVQHGGGAPGFSAQTIHYPDHGLAIVVLANFGRFDATGFAKKIADIYLRSEFPAAATTAVGDADVTAARVLLSPEQLEAVTGLYRQVGSEKFMRLFVRDRLLRWSRGTGTRGSLEMVPLSENRFVIPGAVPLRFEFSAAIQGGFECRTTSSAQPPATFQRLEPFMPSSEQLSDYAGDYASAELEVTYAVTAHDSTLRIRIPGRGDGFELKPSGRDVFQTDGGEAFTFHRDAGGKITNFTFASNGAWGLRFERIKR